MDKKNCDIVRDLFPLYAEDMLSAASRDFVERQIKDCPNCKTEIKRLTGEAGNGLPQNSAAEEEALPLKQVKKKLGRRRLITVCVTVLLTVAAIITYFALRPVSVDYGESDTHSIEEIDAAVTVVRLHFLKMSGCKLYSLSYAGDERCAAELAYANRGGAVNYTDCIVLNSVFRSPVVGGGAWEANELYTWSWIIAKTGPGVWTLINYGNA